MGLWKKIQVCGVCCVILSLLGELNATESTFGEDRILIDRLIQLNGNIADYGLRPFPGVKDQLLTGYAYGEFYDWDLYFENVYLSHYAINKYDFTNMQVFLDRQHPDGFISRTLKNPRPKQMFKPFLAQLAVLGAKQNGKGYEWLRGGRYEKLVRYVNRWFEYDGDHNGLPVWDSADASGMDNQISRGGNIGSNFDEGVDLACYLYRELKALEVIARNLNKPDDASKFSARANDLAQKVNKIFWDEKEGFYFDRNEKTGAEIPVKSIAGFLPLWAGIAPEDRAKRLVKEHLLNPKEFRLSYPIPTYARDERDFFEGTTHDECNWRGSSWIPTNYMVFHGLLDYGFRNEAKQIAEKSLVMALYRNAVTREYYDSETGAGYGMNPFWGWSSLAYVMKLEYENNYNPMSLSEKLRPLVSEKLGVKFPVTR